MNKFNSLRGSEFSITMQESATKTILLFCLLFVTSISLLVLSLNQPIGDFGNYYYGSKILHEGKNVMLLYSDTHWFNEQIKTYGETNFFENYAPVPPFSLVFYYPFIFLKASTAKLIFNLIGIFILCFSLIRILRQELTLNNKYFISFIVLLFPLYNNLVQGQAYLLITALLLEIFMANKQQRDLLTGFYIAIVFLLKLFPVLILGYFIIRKQYKAVIWSGVMILILLGITCVIVDPNIVFNYYANIVPRLLQNQVIDPFYYGHQSLDIFLKNMFYYDALANPDPVLNFPTLYVLIKSCCVGSLLYLGYSLTKAGDSFKMYSLVVCLIILLSPYLPSYFFIMLLPFTLSIFWFKNRILLFIMVSILCNIPLYLVEDLPLPIKYFRIILLVLTFLFVLYKLHLQINYKVYAFVVAIALVVGFIGFDSTPTSYFIMANEKGIYYDLKISKNSLVVERCLGSKDFSDTLKYAEKIITAKEMDSHPLLTERQGNVKKIFLINDNTLIYLSDIHQGVGMYKVHAQKIR